jgi:lactate dehydrogenase-like 2-hydroxyacid dehydrogenase
VLILFQEGIPDIFFPQLERYGCRIERFPTRGEAARKNFEVQKKAEAIFFRANFSLAKTELDLLPNLRVAALVSTGSDNIDATAVAARQIRLITGEGANAQAVFDYVVQALLFGGLNPAEQSVGIVGAGRVGQKVLSFLNRAGVRTAYYDPFLENRGSLAEALCCDFISFHVPLTRSGAHKTEAMLNADYFSAVKKRLRIIQTCRGEIWDKIFYRGLESSPLLEILAQDVYPVEPPSVTDLGRARFSTPHIAGYSTQGRLGGILKGIRALFPDFSAGEFLPAGKAWFLDAESLNFAENVAGFSQIRDGYFWRKEFGEYNAAEQDAFRNRFPQVPDGFFSFLFRQF